MAGKAVRLLSDKQKAYTLGGGTLAGMSGLYVAGRGRSAQDEPAVARVRQDRRNRAAGALGGAGAAAAAYTYGGAKAQQNVTRRWSKVKRDKDLRGTLSQHKKAYRARTGIDFNTDPGKVGLDFYEKYPLRTKGGRRIPTARTRRALAVKNRPAVLAATLAGGAALGAHASGKVQKDDIDPRMARMVRRYERLRDSAAPVVVSGAGGAYLGRKFGTGLAEPFADRYADWKHGNFDAKRVRRASPWSSREVADAFGDAARWRKQGARRAVKSRVGLAGAAVGAGLGGGLALNAQLRRRARERQA